MAKRTRMPSAVPTPPMPAYGRPLLRLHRDAPGARWARMALRAVVIAGLAGAVIELVTRRVR